MKTVSLSGSLRENVGKKDAKKSRKLGLIPCVLYGGEEQIHFTILEKHFDKIIFTPEVYLINLTIDDKDEIALISLFQQHREVVQLLLGVGFPGHRAVVEG